MYPGCAALRFALGITKGRRSESILAPPHWKRSAARSRRLGGLGPSPQDDDSPWQGWDGHDPEDEPDEDEDDD